MDEARFWRLTPRMVIHIATAARRRLDNEHNGRAWLAWHIAVLPKMKRMPKLETLMAKRRGTKRQTTREMMDIFKMITAGYGGRAR